MPTVLFFNKLGARSTGYAPKKLGSRPDTQPSHALSRYVNGSDGVPPRLLGIIAAGQLGGGGEMTAQLQFFKDCLIRQRQTLLADWLRVNKPRSKLIVLDANPDIVAERDNFMNAFLGLHGGVIEYHNNAEVLQAELTRSL